MLLAYCNNSQRCSHKTGDGLKTVIHAHPRTSRFGSDQRECCCVIKRAQTKNSNVVECKFDTIDVADTCICIARTPGQGKGEGEEGAEIQCVCTHVPSKTPETLTRAHLGLVQETRFGQLKGGVRGRGPCIAGRGNSDQDVTASGCNRGQDQSAWDVCPHR